MCEAQKLSNGEVRGRRLGARNDSQEGRNKNRKKELINAAKYPWEERDLFRIAYRASPALVQLKLTVPLVEGSSRPEAIMANDVCQKRTRTARGTR
jgi:hypothetical protein